MLLGSGFPCGPAGKHRRYACMCKTLDTHKSRGSMRNISPEESLDSGGTEETAGTGSSSWLQLGDTRGVVGSRGCCTGARAQWFEKRSGSTRYRRCLE